MIQVRQVPIMGAPLYRAPAWRPARFIVSGPPRAKVGQTGALAAMGAIPLLFGAALGAGAAWVGFSTGSKEKGLLSALGYTVGSLGALGALFGVVGTLFWIGGVSLIGGEIEKMQERRESFRDQRTQEVAVPPATPSAVFPETPAFPEFPEFSDQEIREFSQ